MAFSLELSLIILFTFLATLSASPLKGFSIIGYPEDDLPSHDSLLKFFESWMSKHGKMYDTLEEKIKKFQVFKGNLLHIDRVNSRRKSYWLGLNEFADMTHEEFKARYLGINVKMGRERKNPSLKTGFFRYASTGHIAKSVDWRKKGAVTRVKNQGSCGMTPLFFVLGLSLRLMKGRCFDLIELFRELLGVLYGGCGRGY